MFWSPALTGKPKTKESKVRSHERTQIISLTPNTLNTEEEVDDQNDFEAETSPDLIEGDIAISEVSAGEIMPVCVYAEF